MAPFYSCNWRSMLTSILSIRNTESHRYVKAVRHGKSGAPPRCRLIKIRRTLNFSLRSIAYIDFVRNGFVKFAYKNTLRKKIPQGNFAMYGYFKRRIRPMNGNSFTLPEAAFAMPRIISTKKMMPINCSAAEIMPGTNGIKPSARFK